MGCNCWKILLYVIQVRIHDLSLTSKPLNTSYTLLCSKLYERRKMHHCELLPTPFHSGFLCCRSRDCSLAHSLGFMQADMKEMGLSSSLTKPKYVTVIATKTTIKSINHLKVSSCTSALQGSISTQLHSTFQMTVVSFSQTYRLLPW